MAERICPECDARTDQAVCPKCGIRTLKERRAGDRVDPMLGKVLDERYRIESVIGRGGMGAVYKGVQLATRQVVAIKVIRGEHAEDTDAAKRFHREARAASLLTHPHTIRVFDFGQSEDDDLYMVLEFLNGRTLAKVRKEETRLAEGRLAKIAGEVCRSLAEAHAAGLVHRDLKPENIMLVDTVGDRDFVKVLDFGIAKFLSGSSAGESAVTRSGSVVGTPHYMSPEQASGSRTLTAAVDVYALGVILWEALSGARPYVGDSVMEVLRAHISAPIPDLAPDCAVSDEMRALVKRMMAKDPAARPAAVELVEVFERLRFAAGPAVRATGPVPVPAPRPPEAPEPTQVMVANGPEDGTAVLDAPPAGARGGTLQSESVSAVRRSTNRLPWIAAGLAVVAALVSFGGWWVVSSSRTPEPPAETPAPALAPDPGPVPVPAPVPVPVPEPVPVPVSVPAPAPAKVTAPAPTPVPARSVVREPKPRPAPRPATPKPAKGPLPVED